MKNKSRKSAQLNASVCKSKDMDRACELVGKYALNPISYIILEKDKEHFFSKDVEGVIGYIIVDKVAVVAGDPICSLESTDVVLDEFRRFCNSKSLSICFCQVSDASYKYFRKSGFGLQEYGKEAIINLQEYSIAGSKTAKIRWAKNKMGKLGVVVKEYLPHINKNIAIEDQIYAISSEWLEMKKGSELSFTLGSLSLEDPMDRRYFYAEDVSGEILGFIICLPYKMKKGYFIDVTRRKKSAPLGIMEKIVTEMCDMLKDEGAEELSLGVAPLADIGYENDLHSLLLYKAFKFIYNRMNGLYGFKALYDYKKKYNPCLWESRYIAYSTKIMTPKISLAMIKAKNPHFLKDLFSYKNNDARFIKKPKQVPKGRPE